MASDLRAILGLEVPVIVLLGERRLSVREVTALAPGAIIELPKKAEEELTLLVNNKEIGTGLAVKVGENFGIKISFVGDLKNRIEALGEESTADKAEEEAAAMAEALLAGQL